MEQLVADEGTTKALDPIELYHSPSPRPSTKAGGSGSSLVVRQKRATRASRACDVCRFNHRKCPGPAPGSDDCTRCIKQHKLCTWSAHQNRSSSRASTSPSPKTPKVRKISIRRSKSLPSPLQPQYSNPQPRLPLLDVSASSSSSTRSSSEEQGPATPVEAPHALPFNTQKDAESIQADETFIPHLPTEPSTAPQHLSRQHPEPAAILPEWFLDCLALADKHNLLLFPMPLERWEERQLRRDGDPRSAVGLRCAVPSDIDPLPTLEEAVEMLDYLSLDMRLFPDAYAAFRDSINARLYRQRRRVKSAASSDEEPWKTSAASGTSLNNDIVPTSSTPRLPPVRAEQQNNDIIADDIFNDSSSEPEPDFSIDLTSDTSDSSHFAITSPYRHKAGRDQFDTFLYSPCQCLAAQPAQFATRQRTSADVSSVDVEFKDEQASWEEVMPDVLTDASLDTSVENYLCVEDVDLLD